MARGRGGRRTPANPAAVSGPGALARRTDGGPGQPIRSFPAEFQGQRQQLSSLQGAAPLANASQASPQGAAPFPFPQGIGGPTQRPAEPVTAGLPAQQTKVLARDPDALIRYLYSIYPHPSIQRLLNDETAP